MLWGKNNNTMFLIYVFCVSCVFAGLISYRSVIVWRFVMSLDAYFCQILVRQTVTPRGETRNVYSAESFE